MTIFLCIKFINITNDGDIAAETLSLMIKIFVSKFQDENRNKWNFLEPEIENKVKETCLLQIQRSDLAINQIKEFIRKTTSIFLLIIRKMDTWPEFFDCLESKWENKMYKRLTADTILEICKCPTPVI